MIKTVLMPKDLFISIIIEWGRNWDLLKGTETSEVLITNRNAKTMAV